eukprot:9105574-Pyramimonas_sp.AAC.1
MSEHVAIALCGQIANRPTLLAADCLAAIRVLQQQVGRQVAASSKFAGVRLFAQSLEGTQFVQQGRHVKAH